MLYALVGNGDANKKEVLHSLRSLKAAAEHEGDEFWMMLCEEKDPSPTVVSILAWLGFEDPAYYETVCNPDEETSSQYLPDHRHEARRPVDRMVTIIPQRVQEGEKYTLLVLSDDIDSDEDVLYAITKAIDTGIPVYDLGGQMVPLVLDNADEPSGSYEDADSFLAALDEEAPPMEFTRDDLETLTLAELKAQVKATGVTPSDLRSKESIIDALLGVETEEVAENEPPSEPTKMYFLTVIRADGSAEMRQLSPSQAALIG